MVSISTSSVISPKVLLLLAASSIHSVAIMVHQMMKNAWLEIWVSLPGDDAGNFIFSLPQPFRKH